MKIIFKNQKGELLVVDSCRILGFDLNCLKSTEMHLLKIKKV